MLNFLSYFALIGFAFTHVLYASEPVEEEVPEVEQTIAPEEHEKKAALISNPDADEDNSAGFLTDGFVLQGLDKVTARTFEISGTLNEPYEHKTLTLYVRKCWKPGPDENPDAIAYVDIFERKVDMEPVQIFSGWMFAREHSVSALEHPVYDVWIKACAGKETPYRPVGNGKVGAIPDPASSSESGQEAGALQDAAKNTSDAPLHKPSARMEALYRGLNVHKQSKDDVDHSTPEAEERHEEPSSQ